MSKPATRLLSTNVELWSNVQRGLVAKQTPEQIAANFDMDWYQDWTGKPARENVDNVKHVYEELRGTVNHERLGLRGEPLNAYADDFPSGERYGCRP